MFNCDRIRAESFRIWIPPFPPRRRPPAGWARAGGGSGRVRGRGCGCWRRAERVRVLGGCGRGVALAAETGRHRSPRPHTTLCAALHGGTAHRLPPGTGTPVAAPPRGRGPPSPAAGRARGRARPGAAPPGRPWPVAGSTFRHVGQKIAPDKTLSVNEQHARG